MLRSLVGSEMCIRDSLNLGLNDQTVEGLSRSSGNPRFAWDCYRRFIQMYGDVVMGVQARNEEEEEPFHKELEKLKISLGVSADTELTTQNLKTLVTRYKALIKKRTRSVFPQDVMQQLWGAIGAVFGSWKNERAILYRQEYGIPAEWGTAVNIQSMVFGNTGNDSGTGVAFTRRSVFCTGNSVRCGAWRRVNVACSLVGAWRR